MTPKFHVNQHVMKGEKRLVVQSVTATPPFRYYLNDVDGFPNTSALEYELEPARPYSAYVEYDDESKCLKAEVINAMSSWKPSEQRRNEGEIHAFAAGFEAAMRINENRRA